MLLFLLYKGSMAVYLCSTKGQLAVFSLLLKYIAVDHCILLTAILARLFSWDTDYERGVSKNFYCGDRMGQTPAQGAAEAKQEV